MSLVLSTAFVGWLWRSRFFARGERTVLSALVLVFVLLSPSPVDAQCPNNCNGVGSCTIYGRCVERAR